MDVYISCDFFGPVHIFMDSWQEHFSSHDHNNMARAVMYAVSSFFDTRVCHINHDKITFDYVRCMVAEHISWSVGISYYTVA